MLNVRAAIVVGAVILSGHARAQDDAPWAPAKAQGAIRVATFNVWDYPFVMGDASRHERLASVVRELRPDVILLNELAFNRALIGSPGEAEYGDIDARVFATQVGKFGGPRYEAFAAPVNTGIPSGFDLNNDGKVVVEPGSRGYGEDCFGYGEFPGQYGMALLVRKDVGRIDRDSVRTFREFLWKDMPGALLPEGWYSDEALAALRLSSKSHWDIPVVLRDGTVLHILASHPTPPVFDGPEDRNGRRNHDEIRLWADYISGGERGRYIVDDQGMRGGLDGDALFVIVGDMNADPNDGDGRGAIRQLLGHPRVLANEPRATGERATLNEKPDEERLRVPVEPTDTALFGLRADYVLPSAGFEVVRTGMVREESPEITKLADGFPTEPWWMPLFPSDHFPVYVDVRISRKD
ncbi:MAG: endonuclease/exonuclease/phosphatase family protein [Phycisphaerales bacterium]